MVIEPLELTQAYRQFMLSSPWETRMDDKVRVEAEPGAAGGAAAPAAEGAKKP